MDRAVAVACVLDYRCHALVTAVVQHSAHCCEDYIEASSYVYTYICA
jgi:hypothetical protein